MKVKDLIELLQAQDQEAEAVVCGMDGANYMRATEVTPVTVCRVSSACGEFEKADRCGKGQYYEALSAPFVVVHID